MSYRVGYTSNIMNAVNNGTYETQVDPNAMWHQVATRKNGGSAGTMTIKVKPRGASSFESLTYNGQAVSMTLNNDVTYGPFAGCFDAMQFAITSYNGTDVDIYIAGV